MLHQSRMLKGESCWRKVKRRRFPLLPKGRSRLQTFPRGDGVARLRVTRPVRAKEEHHGGFCSRQAQEAVDALLRKVLLERGRARVHRMVDRTVEQSVLQPVRVKLDPGNKTTGLALVREAKTVEADTGKILRTLTVLMLLELQHRSPAIRDALAQRRAFRRRRRGNPRYRSALFDNRTRPAGCLPPSLQHRVDTTMTWVNRLATQPR